MIDTSDVRARLTALLDARSLPRGAALAATAMLERFDAPVRVTFLGLPGSGRARLMNHLVGDDVLPEGRALPTLCLVHGAVPRSVGTLASGEQASWPGLPIDAIEQAGTVYLDLARPLATLREFSFLELATDDTAEDQLAAMAWAEDRTDIALWISRGYGPAEAALWARAPDRLRDNGYLVMTGGTAAPEATQGFRAAFRVDDAAGTGPLMDELRACAQRGRQGLVDHALLLLNRFENLRPTRQLAPPPADEAPPAPAPTQAAPASRPLTAPLAPTGPAPRAHPETMLVPAQAVAYLRKRAVELDRLIDSLAELPEKRVLGFCLETVEELVEKVSALDAPDPATAEIEEMVLEAADVIMLLQSEDGIEPATDAITLLLQLRRDLEARLAA
jgi:hypothetical protein